MSKEIDIGGRRGEHKVKSYDYIVFVASDNVSIVIRSN